MKISLPLSLLPASLLLHPGWVSGWNSNAGPILNIDHDVDQAQLEEESVWLRTLSDTISSLPPTSEPTAATIAGPTGAPTAYTPGFCVCPTPTPSSTTNCPPNLGDCISEGTGLGSLDTYPLIQAGPNILGRDDSVSLLIGGNFFGKRGVEIEGKIVTIGDFNILSGSGFTSLVRSGFGSNVIPNDGEDAVIVGGNLAMDTDITVSFSGDGVNVVHRGGNLGQGAIFTKGNVTRDRSLSFAKYRGILEDAKVKAEFWSNLPANGIFITRDEHPTGNRVELLAGDTDCLQVYHIDSDDLNFRDFGTLVQLNPNLADKTILLNIKSDANGTATIANLAKFIDPFGDTDFQFNADTTANILWNFYDAQEVILGDGLTGNGQFQGSLLVPHGSLTISFPGHSGRILVQGDVCQDWQSSELHNYEFDPFCPLPLPELCPIPEATSQPSQVPSQAPTPMFATEGICIVKTSTIEEDLANAIADSVLEEDELWTETYLDSLSSMAPTPTPAPTLAPSAALSGPAIAGMCICLPPTNVTSTCPPNLGACFSEGSGNVTTYPKIQTSLVPLGRDDSVSVLVGGDFVGKDGAEIEGKIVTVGSFRIVSGFNSLVRAGFGSQVVPNDGTDVLLVGQDLDIRKDVAILQRVNVVYGGDNTGTGKITTLGGNITQQQSPVNLDKYTTALTDLQTKSKYWSELPANGVFISRDEHFTGNRVELLAGDDDCLQVFHLEHDDLDFRDFGTLIQLDSTLSCKTVLINVAASADGIVTIANIAKFIDPFGNTDFDFDSDVTANILWNFYNATDTVVLGDGLLGNGQFRGSVVVPFGDVNITFPGHSGRMIVAGDLCMDVAGGELYNYEFDPICPLPVPEDCPSAMNGRLGMFELDVPVAAAAMPMPLSVEHKNLRG